MNCLEGLAVTRETIKTVKFTCDGLVFHEGGRDGVDTFDDCQVGGVLTHITLTGTKEEITRQFNEAGWSAGRLGSPFEEMTHLCDGDHD